MGSKATYKDVCYALQFTGEKLLKTLTPGSAKIEWTFAKTGRSVDGGAASKFLSSDHCMPIQDGLFASHSQTFGWKE